MYHRFLTVLLLLLGITTLRADEPKAFEVGGFTFERPPEWQWVPVNSPMRKAQLKVPGKDPTKFADIIFFHFGSGQGGSVQDNAQRWIKQFRGKEGGEKIEMQNLGGTKVTIVTTEGTFTGGMPGGPATSNEDYALLGAIIEQPEGAVFVKMTGPAAIVKESREKFLAFVKAGVSGPR